MIDLIVRHKRMQYQRSATDSVFVHLGDDLPAAVILSQSVDYGSVDDPYTSMGPVDCLFSTPAEAITGKAKSPRLLKSSDLKCYAFALAHAAKILDEWEMSGRIPSALVQDTSS